MMLDVDGVVLARFAIVSDCIGLFRVGAWVVGLMFLEVAAAGYDVAATCAAEALAVADAAWDCAMRVLIGLCSQSSATTLVECAASAAAEEQRLGPWVDQATRQLRQARVLFCEYYVAVWCWSDGLGF